MTDWVLGAILLFVLICMLRSARACRHIVVQILYIINTLLDMISREVEHRIASSLVREESGIVHKEMCYKLAFRRCKLESKLEKNPDLKEEYLRLKDKFAKHNSNELNMEKQEQLNLLKDD